MVRSKIIEVRDLVAIFGDKLILNGVNFDVYENEILVILGTSGCGKSTLLKNLIRLYYPNAGSVRMFGEEITTLDEDEMESLLKKVGVLFQSGALMNSLTVGENVAIPLKQHTGLPDELIARLVDVKLGLVELAGAKHLLPSELSGGMKKRAALARAIVMDPPLLLGDEPSAGLDPVTSAAIDELILKLRAQLNMTLVIVTHELPSIHHIADRILFLDSGRILFTGTVEEAKRSGIQKVETFFEKGAF